MFLWLMHAVHKIFSEINQQTIYSPFALGHYVDYISILSFMLMLYDARKWRYHKLNIGLGE